MKRALDSVHDMLQPGMTVSDVDNLVRNIISDNDVGAKLITRSGYSIGIAFPPSWDEGYMLSLKQGQSTILREGMTFHLIPWMWGIDGNKTCGISDTIYITKEGCSSFFENTPRDFTVKPNESASADCITLSQAVKPQSLKLKPAKSKKNKHKEVKHANAN